jgi:hypothetical protein
VQTNGVRTAEIRQEVARAVRSLGHALVAHEADETTLARIAAEVAAMAKEVARGPQRRRGAEVAELLPLITDPDRVSFSSVLLERPISGAANPTAADVTFRREGDEIVADVRFGPAFEGAPGRIHGGMVAAVFDDVTGGALALARAPAYTARLTVTGNSTWHPKPGTGRTFWPEPKRCSSWSTRSTSGSASGRLDPHQTRLAHAGVRCPLEDRNGPRRWASPVARLRLLCQVADGLAAEDIPATGSGKGAEASGFSAAGMAAGRSGRRGWDERRGRLPGTGRGSRRWARG